MAAVAVLIVNVPSGNLLRIESKFGVAFAALDFATRQSKKNHARENYKDKAATLAHFFAALTAASTMLSIASFTRFPGALRLFDMIENASNSPFAVTA